MPDNSSPFSGLSEGFNKGMDYAKGAMELQNQQQLYSLKKQELDNQMYQHQIQVGKTLYDQVADITNEIGPKVRNAKIEALKKYGQVAGVPIDDTWLVALNDPEYDAGLKEMVRGLGKSDPEMLANAYSQVSGSLSQKASMDFLNQINSNLKTNQAAKIAAQGHVDAAKQTAAGRQNNLDFRQTKSAQDQFNTVTKQTQFRTSGALRLEDLFKKIDSGELTNTAQLMAAMNREAVRMEQGAGQIAEGSEKNMLMQSYYGATQNFLQKLTGSPTDAITPEIKQQFKEMVHTMASSYHDQFDREVETLRAGMTDKQAGVIEQKAKAFRGNVKKQMGYWGSEEQDRNSADSSNVPSASTQSSASVNTARVDPNTALKNAMQIKDLLNKGSYTPEQRRAKINLAKQVLGEEAVRKAGLN